MTKLENQWDDFIFRKFDLYAFSKYQILLSWMGELQNQHVLVVGSGSGEFACLLAQQGAIVEALDISPEAVALTEKTADEFGVKLKTHCSFLEDFTTTSRYDWVIATDVIEHISEDQQAVRKMELLTQQGGRLILTVPAMQSLFGYHDRILGHYRRYSKKNLTSLICSSFDVREIRYFGCSLIPIVYLISCILKKPYPVNKMASPASANSWVGKIFNLMLSMERRIHFPIGTSLLLMAQKTSEIDM